MHNKLHITEKHHHKNITYKKWCICNKYWTPIGARHLVITSIVAVVIIIIHRRHHHHHMNSADSNLKCLDTVQYKALLLVTGGMRGSALKSLLAECGKLPLYLRRMQILVKHLIKIDNNNKNSAHTVLKDKSYYHLELKGKSGYKTILEFFTKKQKLKLKVVKNMANKNLPTNFPFFPENQKFKVCTLKAYLWV